MKREDVIKELIEHDLDVIFSSHPERTLAEILEYGCQGYVDWSNEALEELYNETFCNDENDKPIKIKE